MEDIESQGTVESPVEKMLPQSQVNDIVKREKAQAAERVRREMEQQYQGGMQPQGMGGMSSVDPGEMESKITNAIFEKIKQAADQEQRRAQDEQISHATQNFYMKLNQGKDKYSDFDEVMKGFEPSAFAELSLLAGQFDNTSDIMYEVANNPAKLAQLQLLAERSPDLARKELTKLAQSIAKNQQAMQENVSPREPLSRIKSSTGVGADTGEMTLRDYKKADWLRR